MIPGRIGRSVFLFSALTAYLAMLFAPAILVVDGFLDIFWVFQAWGLWTLILSLAIVFRLHDLGLSGYWVAAWLLYAGPLYVGFMVLETGTGGVEELGSQWRVYPTLLVIYQAGIVISLIPQGYLCTARGQKGVNRWGKPPGHSRPRTRRAATPSEPSMHAGSEERDGDLYLAGPPLS